MRTSKRGAASIRLTAPCLPSTQRPSASLAREARQALDFTLYSIDELGRPRDLAHSAAAGGWQEDAHTDVIHNYVDALRAFPEWIDST